MNHTLIRLLCIILLAATLITFGACGKKEQESVDSQTVENVANTDAYSEHIASLGVKDYGGKEFVIATRNTETDSFFTLHPDANGYMGYSVSDAMYSRDLKMSDT